MSVTPTHHQRPMRLADFATLVEALDYAALCGTGVNFHDLRGNLVEAMGYDELRRRARATAARLLAVGLQPGERVGLMADSTPYFAEAFFACQYAGLLPLPMPLPTPLGGREAYEAQISRMLAAAQARAVLLPEGFGNWVGPAAAQAGTELVLTLSELPEAQGVELPAITPDDTSYLQFSSGSTRSPTGVVVTHRALMSNAVAITRDGLKVTPDDRAVSWLPLYHDMGLIGFLLSPVACQMSVDLLPTAAFVRRPLLWLELIARNGGTVAYSPTFGFELCAKRADAASADLDLSAWRIAGVGGDMVRSGPLQTFAERFAGAGFRPDAFVASYGMAEASLALTMAPLHQGLTIDVIDIDQLERDGLVASGEGVERPRAFVRCGPPLAGHQIEVRDEDGEVLPEGRMGRLFARGPSLMREYFRDPVATAAVLSEDGWLETGDLGYIAGGEVTPTGRSKDMILFNGRNIWPQDLEWTAESGVNGVRSGDVAAFAIDTGEDEKIVLLVQCRTSDADSRQRLREDVTGLMRARHGVDTEVRLVPNHALPRTSSGKLSRSKARGLYESGAFDLVES